MSLIKLQGNASGTGAFTIAAPNGNTDRTLTLPDATGTVNVSGLANEVPAGSAGAPAIYPTGDTNTGIFFPAADTIAFSEGGAEVARFDSSGSFGVNDTSPSTRGRFSVRNTDSRFFAVETTSAPRWRYDDNGVSDFVLANHGTTTAGHGIGLMGQLGSTGANSANAGYIRFLTEGTWGDLAASKDAAITFGTATDGVIGERARITSAGTLSVGNTAITPAFSGTGATSTIPVNSGTGGALCLVRGYDTNSGIAYCNAYVVAVKVNNGGPPDVAATLLNASGASKTITFSSSGGFVVLTPSAATLMIISFFGL